MEHKQEITLLLKRYKAVEWFYALETEDERSMKAELAYQQRLTVARSTYREIIRKQQLVKIGVTAAAVAGGAVGALGFGIVGLAAGAAVVGGLWSGIRGGQLPSEADKAKQTMQETEEKISDTKRSIQLEDETRINRMIPFLKKLQEFSVEYEKVSEKCNDQAALAQKLDEMYGREGAYHLYDSRGTELVNLSFKDALAAFIEMTEKGSRYVFSVRFHCDICKYQRLEFPYVISDELVCAKCYTEVQF